MAEKQPQDQPTETTPAQEWGQRQQTGEEIESGGKKGQADPAPATGLVNPVRLNPGPAEDVK